MKEGERKTTVIVRNCNFSLCERINSFLIRKPRCSGLTTLHFIKKIIIIRVCCGSMLYSLCKLQPDKCPQTTTPRTTNPGQLVGGSFLGGSCPGVVVLEGSGPRGSCLGVVVLGGSCPRGWSS